MNRLLLIAVIACASCLPDKVDTIQGVNEKLREAILLYHSGGVPLSDTVFIDSVSIASVDTITLKSSVKVALQKAHSTLEFQRRRYQFQLEEYSTDTLLLTALRLQKNVCEKAGIKYDSSSCTEQRNKMSTGLVRLQESGRSVKDTSKLIDSLGVVYFSADSVSLYEYYVGAVIYRRGAVPEQGMYTVTKNWKVRPGD